MSSKAIPNSRPSARDLLLVALAAAGLIVLAALVFYGPDIALGRSLFIAHDLYGSDIWHQNLPSKHFYQNELRAGRLPHWCPHIGTGFPLLAEGQVAALYPLNLLLYGLLPLALAFNWGLLANMVLAGAFTAMLARQVGASIAGSLLAAVAFAFSGFFVTHLKHVNLLSVAAWSPLLLLLVARHAASRSRRSLVLLALTVAAMILAGHPQILYNNLLVAAGLTCLVTYQIWKSRHSLPGAGKSALAFAGGIGGAVLIGILLGAPQLLPSAELNQLGPRQGGLSMDDATEWQYRWRDLALFLSPMAQGDPGQLRTVTVLDPATGEPRTDPQSGGPLTVLRGFVQDREHPALFWEISAYVGLLPLFLAALGAAIGFRRAPVRALLAMLVAALLLALGKNGGLFYAAYLLLPGFDLFRFHSRFLLYVDLTLALLAAIGLTLVLERLRWPARTRALLASLVVLASFLDLGSALGDHNPKVSARDWLSPPPSIVRIKRESATQNIPPRYIVNDPRREIFRNAYFRAGGWKGDLSPYNPARTLADPNANVLWEVGNPASYLQIYPSWMKEMEELLFLPGDGVTGAPGRVRSKAISLLGVEFILDPFAAHQGLYPGLDVYPGDTLLQAPSATGPRPTAYRVALLRNPLALPRAMIVPRAHSVSAEPENASGPSEAQRILLADDFDPRQSVLIAQPVPAQTRILLKSHEEEPGESDGAAVRIVEYSSLRVRLAVEAPRGSWLVLSDTFYPGWTATIDGEAAPVHRANISGRAVRVEPGSHQVVFEFRPRAFRSGLLLAGLGSLLLAATALLAKRG